MFKLITFLFYVKAVFCAHVQIPSDLDFGVATAAYQVEGVGMPASLKVFFFLANSFYPKWRFHEEVHAKRDFLGARGKGEGIWDRFTHTHPEMIMDHSTGDVACDSYHLWQEDVKIVKEIGVQYYRFSISWTRLLPTGFSDKINPDGVRYYNGLINELLKNNIEPMVTLYHWNLPQSIQDLGGWTNDRTVQYFGDFVQVVFQLFGDRVKKWITVNEPNSICEDTYGDGMGAPHIVSGGIGDYLCGRALLLGHATAYHIYDKMFRKEQNGKIGITIDSIWAEPKSNSPEDIDAAERDMQMTLGWWANPIFSKGGDYPQVMRDRIAEKSRRQNFSSSRLPPFSKDEVALLKGSADFFGLNHYHTFLATNLEYPDQDGPSFIGDKGTFLYQDPFWQPSPMVVPWGFTKLLHWIRKTYDNPLVYITENGYGDKSESLNDKDRVNFIKLMLKAVLQAKSEGCNIKKIHILERYG
ncbi:hypothetical protein NQ317_013756 [Molorchus minor]|uniref:Uncharacterized protein n=1 Tax=Molorchus minor TaxID=1323400 RepID=A0ABQ9JR55_9CUCU|nr:hypothetical protein NQ317_013756 [Molorchus minor]